jgi:hypothetical protein
MKPVLSAFAISMMLAPAFAAAPHMTPATGRGRVSMANQMMAAPRAVMSPNQIQALAAQPEKIAVSETFAEDKLAINPPEMKPAEKDMREREKRACLQNNIGIGNTFVWASRYGNLGSYSTMIEDIEEPDNNTCFVKVELKSDDPKINVADVPSKYFEMGRDITCGEWANYDTLKSSILDAKKSARTWATVGGAVGGAAIGVGAMELFGNQLIGGKVMGQKDLEGLELLESQLAALKKDNEVEYNRFIKHLGELKCACKSSVWTSDEQKPDACKEYEYAFSLPGVNNKTCSDN